MKIVEGVFGTGAKFEEHAAVTELFFCASADTHQLPDGSDCADEYFGDVLERVKPKVIICIGERVLDYFQKRYEEGEARTFDIPEKNNRVVWIPHPNNDRITEQGRQVCIDRAIAEIQSILGRGGDGK